MSETPSPLFNIFFTRDVGGLIVRKLRGKDLSMFHERKWFNGCIPLMRLEMAKFFTTVQNPSVVPDEKIPLMYKIYYGSRRNLETGIILISLQVQDPFFTQYFIDYLATKLSNAFSRHDVQDMWEWPAHNAIVNKKVIRKAAELDKLDWIHYSAIYGNICAVMFGYAKGGHIHRVNSFFNMYKNNIIIHIMKDNLISIMTGAAAGGHFDILGKFYLKYLEEFGRKPDLTKILSYAARGGHVEIFEKYSKMLETYEMDITEHLQYYAAQGNNMHFIKDSLVRNYTDIIKGYIKGGHIDCLPSPLYKYTADHFRTAIAYGHVDILKKIWDDNWADRFLYNDWLDEYEEIWVELQEFGDEIRTKQSRIRKDLKKKYGKNFVNSHEAIGWIQVQKDMETANGNLDQALLFALRRSDLTHIAFYYDKGATNKQEAIQEAKNMRNRKFAMEDLARIFEEVYIYEDEILDNIFEQFVQIWQ